MNYPFYLARRLSLSASGRKSSPAVKVASAAVALSVAVMLASIAIVAGFREEISKKVIGFNSELKLFMQDPSPEEGNIVSLQPSLREILDSTEFIDSYALQVSVPAVVKTPENFKGIYLRSASDSVTRAFISSNLEEGRMADGDEIVISRQTAKALGLKKGMKSDIYFFSDDIRVRRLRISGIFNSHFDQYDGVIAYAPLELIQKVSGLKPNQGSYINIGVKDFSAIHEKSMELQSILNRATAEGTLYKTYGISNAEISGAGFFQWLRLLDTNVWVILILMSFVGCVTLISGMLIIILDKKRFIGLMKALGAPTAAIRKVFIYVAIRVGLVGMLLGNGIMLPFLWAQKRYHLIPLDPDAYYIDFVPVRFEWPDIIILNLVVLLLIYLVLILPSRFVAGISPAETMRDE